MLITSHSRIFHADCDYMMVEAEILGTSLRNICFCPGQGANVLSFKACDSQGYQA